MGVSVLTKLMMLEKQVRVMQLEKDRLGSELIEARLDIVDLEERLMDLSYVATELHKLSVDIEIQVTEKERFDLIKQSMDKLAIDNELLNKENKELKNDMTYLNLRLDKNIKSISSGDVIVPQSDDDLNHSGYDATKLANDDSAATLSINPNSVPESKAIQSASSHFKQKTNKYSNPLGHRHQASESWIAPNAKHEPVLHAAHYLTKKKYPNSTTGLKKPLDMTTKYKRYNDKHPKSTTKKAEPDKSRLSMLEKIQSPKGRIPVRPSIDLTSNAQAINYSSRKPSNVSAVSSASSTTLGRVSPKSSSTKPNHHNNNNNNTNNNNNNHSNHNHHAR
ncbi:hypothetical protein [Botrytis cinerea negative-stranded RNA virus 5]|uniref:Uncharacterized protein n=1 Tax=Botrytis cinerea negative-stranded RNA virus 5 TaxID=2735940 RepID=A0AAE7AMF6_9MONO|nr:hypothetical protein QKS23_gp1 [Botrytis cinerea negative-stranded RNA virus 5]QJW39410.1 hypothetical protein [Botrytis cinerea negative-stranded RNA virus 5]